MPDPNMKSRTIAANRAQWRAWLKKNHAKNDEVWLVFYKKHTGKPTIAYMESVEEALCFGWIDGMKRRIDDETYAYRFTPRKESSKWSPTNLKLARKLITEGKMTKAGMEAYERRQHYAPEVQRARQAKALELSPEFERAIKKNKKAWAAFQNLAPGYRKRYVQWLETAKRPETRKKRLKETIELLARNEKLGMR